VMTFALGISLLHSPLYVLRKRRPQAVAAYRRRFGTIRCPRMVYGTPGS